MGTINFAKIYVSDVKSGDVIRWNMDLGFYDVVETSASGSRTMVTVRSNETLSLRTFDEAIICRDFDLVSSVEETELSNLMALISLQVDLLPACA